MNTGSEPEKDIISTPITIRNDRVGLHTSPVERRSFDATPLHSNQSDTRYISNRIPMRITGKRKTCLIQYIYMYVYTENSIILVHQK